MITRRVIHNNGLKYELYISSYALTHTRTHMHTHTHTQSLSRWHELTWACCKTGCSSHVAADTLPWWLRLCCLTERHPWWHQMFRTSLCMRVSVYMCVCDCTEAMFSNSARCYPFLLLKLPPPASSTHPQTFAPWCVCVLATHTNSPFSLMYLKASLCWMNIWYSKKDLVQ